MLRRTLLLCAITFAALLGPDAPRIPCAAAGEVTATADDGCNATYPKRCGEEAKSGKCCPANSVCCRPRGGKTESPWRCVRSLQECEQLSLAPTR